MRRFSLASGSTLLLAVAASFSACGGLSSKSGPTITYSLRAPMTSAGDAGTTPSRLRSFSLQVLLPVAAPGLETDAIVLSAPDRRLDRYAASRWAAPTPKLLGNLAVETLRARGLLAAVHDDAAPFPADYLLRVSVRRFDANYGDGLGSAPTVQVALDCTVATRNERRLLATFSASGTAKAAGDRMSAVVAAFDTATQSALTVLADQTLAAAAGEAAAN